MKPSSIKYPKELQKEREFRFMVKRLLVMWRRSRPKMMLPDSLIDPRDDAIDILNRIKRLTED